MGIFATVNGEQQTFPNELEIPYDPVVLAADNLVSHEALIIMVTNGELPHGTNACVGGSVSFQYWPPNDTAPSAPYVANGEQGACTVTYDWTGEFYEGSFTGTLTPSTAPGSKSDAGTAPDEPALFIMSGTFRLHD